MQGSAASMTAQAAWTPLWAAPEVFRQERATVKADIWSFGIILWELASKQNVAEFPAYGMTVQMAVRAGCRAPVHAASKPPVQPESAAVGWATVMVAGWLLGRLRSGMSSA